MQEVVTFRTVIYAKDVSNMTGLSPRSAWNLLSKIKKKYRKKKGQFVTVKEYSEFTGIDEESIMPYLRS